MNAHEVGVAPSPRTVHFKTRQSLNGNFDDFHGQIALLFLLLLLLFCVEFLVNTIKSFNKSSLSH